MRHDADNDDRKNDIAQGDYVWHYEKADMEQGAYSLSDDLGKKCAVIFPFDRSRAIDDGDNALLCVRQYEESKWSRTGPHSLSDAITHGCRHANEYRLSQTMDRLFSPMNEKVLNGKDLELIAKLHDANCSPHDFSQSEKDQHLNRKR